MMLNSVKVSGFRQQQTMETEWEQVVKKINSLMKKLSGKIGKLQEIIIFSF